MGNKLFLFFIVLFCSCVKLEKADLVVHNAKIYTVNPEFEIAQAMAIKDGKIIAIGKEHEMKNRFRADQFLDAQTNPIYPGFIDAHAHLLGYGLNAHGVSLKDSKTVEQIEASLSGFIKDKPSQDWIMGYGLSNTLPNDKLFNALNTQFPTHKIYIWYIDGHKMIVSENALSEVFPDAEIKNGVLNDEQINFFLSKVTYTRKQKKQAVRYAQDACVKLGLTSVTDAGITKDEAELYKYLDQENQLKIRVYGMLKPSPETMEDAYKGVYQGDKVTIRSFKLVADGALGSSTAYLLENYLNQSQKGNLLITKDSLIALAELCKETGFQLNVHAIGDGAFRLVSEGMGEVLERTNDLRWRIEHAQMTHPNDVNNLSKYSILPSVQPSHGLSDESWVESKIGANRLTDSYQLKTLLDQNGMIAFGTDFPVEEINPIKTFYSAVVRKPKDGPKAYLENEKIGRIKALKAMTYWNAIAQHQDSAIGSLEIGKEADFIILSRDIITAPEDEIMETQVLATYIKGKAVFKSE